MLKSFILLNILVYVLAKVLPSSNQLDGRIIGGKETRIENYPWQVSLQSDGSHFCGGSLLNEKIVITAAHCLSDIPPEAITIRIGSTTYKQGGQLFKISATKRHEDYDPATMSNDIAVVNLATSVTFGKNAKPIKLAEKAPSTGVKAAVTGWGTTSIVSGAMSPNLQAVLVKMISNKVCGSDVYNYGLSIQPGMICASASGKDSCQGDSGGPLVSDGRLVGIVSWGRGCAAPKLPGVYVDVAYYNSWILKTIDNFFTL